MAYDREEALLEERLRDDYIFAIEHLGIEDIARDVKVLMEKLDALGWEKTVKELLEDIGEYV